MVIRVSLSENPMWCRTDTVETPSAVKGSDHILAVVKDTAKKIALNLFPHGMGESFDGIEWKDNEVTLKLHCCGKRIVEKSNQDGQMVIEENQSVPDREFEISARW